PPNMKIFDSTATNVTVDITTMAKHCAAASTVSTRSNVYVSFDSLAEILCGPLAQPGMHVAMPESPKRAVNSSKWPKLSLNDFCMDYEIPEPFHDKLQKLCIQGPHTLCWISDDDLHQEGGLVLGELGTLHDAEQHWKNHCTWDN
ncbi:hypothetical protein L208DRAFT_1317741, partial [Tricholoma matsutake]